MDAALAFAAELEQRDAVLAGRLAALEDLSRRVEEVRNRAEQLVGFLERLPSDREQLDGRLVGAERGHDAARAGLEQARVARERARGDNAVVAARRHEAHADADVRAAEELRDRLTARRHALEVEAAAADAELRSLETGGRELAEELRSAPRVAAPDPPAPGLDGLADWASRAHAAILVARSGLETERERFVREAYELAAAVLGEPLSVTSVAAVRQRLEGRVGGG